VRSRLTRKHTLSPAASFVRGAGGRNTCGVPRDVLSSAGLAAQPDTGIGRIATVSGALTTVVCLCRRPAPAPAPAQHMPMHAAPPALAQALYTRRISPAAPTPAPTPTCLRTHNIWMPNTPTANARAQRSVPLRRSAAHQRNAQRCLLWPPC
jgi:hypothetical protein